MFEIHFNKVATFKNDILSGLTVALALVPEAVAFAFVAGVDPLVGLYAAFMVGLITACIGGRPGMISGATGALAVVMVSLVADHGVEYLFITVVLMGILQITAGVLKLGKFIRMVPHPVMLGFVNGLAIVIGLAQLEQFKTINDNGVTEWIGGAELLITGSLVGATMALIWLTPKLTKIIPAPLAAIGLVTAVVIGLDLDVSRVGDLASLSAQSIAAGCDVVLLCNASLDERRAVADAAGRMTPAAQSRAEATLAARQTPDEVDIPALEAHLEALLNGPMHV